MRTTRCAGPLEQHWSRDARALEQQEQLVGQLIGLRVTGIAEQLHHAVALARLVVVDDLARRMLDLAHLHRGIGDGAATLAAVGQNFLAVAHPAIELRGRVAGVIARQSLPDFIAFLGELREVGGDQLVLGTEMAIKRHLVRGRGFRDRVDAYGSDAVTIK